MKEIGLPLFEIQGKLSLRGVHTTKQVRERTKTISEERSFSSSYHTPPIPTGTLMLNYSGLVAAL